MSAIRGGVLMGRVVGGGARITADSIFICFSHGTNCQLALLWRYEKKCDITDACISNIVTDSAVGA
jgi:hypothetical protein